jgi:hypothetical protein
MVANRNGERGHSHGWAVRQPDEQPPIGGRTSKDLANIQVHCPTSKLTSE